MEQFPTRKELEIVSSTREWERLDTAARVLQKFYHLYIRCPEMSRAVLILVLAVCWGGLVCNSHGSVGLDHLPLGTLVWAIQPLTTTRWPPIIVNALLPQQESSSLQSLDAIKQSQCIHGLRPSDPKGRVAAARFWKQENISKKVMLGSSPFSFKSPYAIAICFEKVRWNAIRTSPLKLR